MNFIGRQRVSIIGGDVDLEGYAHPLLSSDGNGFILSCCLYEVDANKQPHLPDHEFVGSIDRARLVSFVKSAITMLAEERPQG